MDKSKKKRTLTTKKKIKKNITKKSKQENNVKLKRFTIDNFCEENNKLFKKIYLFLNKPKNIIILMNTLKIFTHPKGKMIVLKEIKKNKDKVHQILKDFHVIMDYYKSNNLVLKSNVGHFILYYEHHLGKIKVKKDEDYLLFFDKIINYPNLISLLKEIFYILSDYRSCIYFMTPDIKFRNTNKENIDEFIKKFYNNQSMCFSIISGYYPNDNSPWGQYYTGAYSCFESLIILKKYYNDPLKSLKIDFKYKKKNNKVKIMKKIRDLYNIKIDKNDKMLNVTNFIILMKKLNYGMHEVIDSVFDIIYEDTRLKKIQKCYIINGIKIFNQKKNFELGVKIFILVNDGYITNVNCFENFRI